MSRSTKAVVTFSTILIIVSSLYFVTMRKISIVDKIRPTEEEPLQVTYINSDVSLDPTSKFWNSIEAVKIHLLPQAARIPYGTEERDIWVKGAYNEHEIGFYIEIEDETEDNGITSKPDASAILFTLGDSPATAQMMGHNSQSNIWHWLSGQDSALYSDGNDNKQIIRELIAVGPGTQNPMAVQNVTGKGEYKENKWRVVLKRNLKSQQRNEIEIKPGSKLKISFATWDGSRNESFSKKSISILRDLKLEGN